MIASRMTGPAAVRPTLRQYTVGVALVCAALIFCAHAPARAQATASPCKIEQLSPQKMVEFGTAFAAAEKRARAWQPDVAVVRLGNTTLGPIDAEARSANWYMVWYSKAAMQRIAFTIANGTLSCSLDADSGRGVPVLKPDYFRDVKQMLATASARGGTALMSRGAQPMVELSVGPRSTGSKGIWFVNYRVKEGPSLQVTFDGNTGRFEQAISN